MLNITSNSYVLPFISKPNLVGAPLIQSGYKALQKEQALASCIQSLLSKNIIERVKNVKSLRFYSRLFLVPKPHQRWRPVIDLSRLNTFLLVERFKMETPESIRASLIPEEWVSSMGVVIHIPIHPNSRKYLRFCHKSQVFQFTSLPVGLAMAPQVFTMTVKEVKLMALTRGMRLHQYLDDCLIRAQSQEKAQVNTQTVLDLTQSLGWIINQEKSKLKPAQGFSFVGYEYHLDSALIKPTQEMAQTSGFDPTTQVKTCFDCKMFDVANWVACLNGENGPGGTPSYEGLSVSPQGALEISSFVGQPPSWTETISAHLECWQNPTNVMKGADLHPKDHSIQLFTDASNEGWGAHLEQASTKGLWSDRAKKAIHKCYRAEGGVSGPSKFQGPVPKPNSSGCYGQLNSISLHKHKGRTHSAEMCTLLWKIVTWCHHYQIALKARHIPGCLNVISDLLSRSNQVQSTEWSLHPCSNISFKSGFVDIFATGLNHKVPLYVSPVPDQNAWDIDALNINWSGLTAYAYLPMALLHRVIQKIRQSSCLIIVIAPG